MIETPTDTPVVPEETQNDYLAYDLKFICDLAKHLNGDRGKAAMLRRNAGNTIAESRNIDWFFHLLGGRPITRLNDGTFKDEEAYFVISTLFASDKASIECFADKEAETKPANGNFGYTLYRLKKKICDVESAEKTFDRRFGILLDADFDPQLGGSLSFRLRQMTKRVIAEKDPALSINWPQLLRDIKRWNGSKKPTQKSWARSYYAPVFKSSDEKPESDEKQDHIQGDY
ncbi:MAG: type I-E CRISPR-associated protein Cse2/CasB [Armatimonadota bacterium]